MARGASIELHARPVPTRGDGSPDSENDRQPSPADDNSSPELGASGREFPSLPPVDGGKDAWLFLAAGLVMEALVWGFPFAFGVFQDYYSTHEPFAGSTNIAIIGTCSMGIMYLDMPLIQILFRLFPRPARWSCLLGLSLICLSLALSSLATQTSHLIATQGILYGLGGSIAYSPCIVWLDEWFVARKGLAYGIMWSGTSIAGIAFPLLLEALLSRWGFRVTLRVWAIVVFVVATPLSYFVRPRLPPAASTNLYLRPLDFSWVKGRRFLLYSLANAVESAGYFLPGIFLPTYARSALGAGTWAAALTVMVSNMASTAGCLVMGSLTDRLHATTCIFISTVGATLGTFLLWGCGSSMVVLYLFCAVYGLFAGSFVSAWAGIVKDIARSGTLRSGSEDAGGASVATEAVTGTSTSRTSSGNVDPSMVLSFLAFGRGVGNVVSGPLSEALVRGYPWQGQAIGGYGSGYGTLIVFTGVTAFFGGGSFLWKKLGWL